MPSTPFICSSSGASTEFNTVSALAPVYEARTIMVGGAMLGYCSIGSEIRPITPRMTIKMDITVDSTGRFMKLSNLIVSLYIDVLRIVAYTDISSVWLGFESGLLAEVLLKLAEVALVGTHFFGFLQLCLILSLCDGLDFSAVGQ